VTLTITDNLGNIGTVTSEWTLNSKSVHAVLPAGHKGHCAGAHPQRQYLMLALGFA
jgi:hypothetical protein